MTADTLAGALEREHREIDRGVEDFLSAPAHGRGRTEPLTRAITALRRHIFLEEAFLFGPLQEAGMVAPIFVMLREHGEIWDTMDGLEAELSRDGDGASASEICRALLAQLDLHNSKEEQIVYSQADAVLGAEAGAGLRAFLAAGRIPNGWVCARAGASARASAQQRRDHDPGGPAPAVGGAIDLRRRSGPIPGPGTES